MSLFRTMELTKQNFIVTIILLGFPTKNSGKKGWFYFSLLKLTIIMREKFKVNWRRLTDPSS